MRYCAKCNAMFTAPEGDRCLGCRTKERKQYYADGRGLEGWSIAVQYFVKVYRVKNAC